MRLNILLAQATGTDISGSLGQVLKLVMQISFISGVILIISGALAIRRGESEGGKQSIVAGAILAGAPMIMKFLFHAFGLDAAVPEFK
jgi:hypothetical protein